MKTINVQVSERTWHHLMKAKAHHDRFHELRTEAQKHWDANEDYQADYVCNQLKTEQNTFEYYAGHVVEAIIKKLKL